MPRLYPHWLRIPGVGSGHQHLLKLLRGSQQAGKAENPTSRAEGTQPKPTQKDHRLGPGVLWRQEAYLVGLGLHGHDSIEGNHEDHHSHASQDRGAQVLREEREQRPSHRAFPGWASPLRLCQQPFRSYVTSNQWGAITFFQIYSRPAQGMPQPL